MESETCSNPKRICRGSDLNARIAHFSLSIIFSPALFHTYASISVPVVYLSSCLHRIISLDFSLVLVFSPSLPIYAV